MKQLYLKIRPVITNLEHVRTALDRGNEHVDIDIAPHPDFPITAQMTPFPQ